MGTSLFFVALLTVLPRICLANPEDTRSATVTVDAVSTDELPFGMSTALSGPASEIGERVLGGFRLAFDAANADGGIRGRRLRLFALDDGYEPRLVPGNLFRLIDEDHVLAVVGNAGTPTAITAVPILSERKVLFFAPHSGAGLLRRKPPDPYVFNYRASYAEEMEEMIGALVEKAGIRPDQIALFTQRDGFGDSAFAGALAALRRHGLDNQPVLHGRYERNTLAVEHGLADLLSRPELPRAVILVGVYGPCAKFIQLARANGLDSLFLAVSFVDANALVEQLGESADGVIVTQVVPHYDSPVPIAAEYRKLPRTSSDSPQPSFAEFEGYISARILLFALQRIDGPVDRGNLVETLNGLGTFDLGLGVPLRLTEKEHQACHHVWPTIGRDGKFVPYSWDQLDQHPELTRQ